MKLIFCQNRFLYGTRSRTPVRADGIRSTSHIPSFIALPMFDTIDTRCATLEGSSASASLLRVRGHLLPFASVGRHLKRLEASNVGASLSWVDCFSIFTSSKKHVQKDISIYFLDVYIYMRVLGMGLLLTLSHTFRSWEGPSQFCPSNMVIM